ncbi:MAG: HAD-IIA family hydrolase [Halolamina sp.]|uniref:HAD-IIA family hydrolase n=1 Tax=Halolamina sp. TaxID=1940283 RepID=UPI002FC3751B
MEYRGTLLDVDGTVVRGEQRLPGADEGIAALSDRGIARLFVSNNPTRRPAAYAQKLRNAGIDATAEEVLTAATTTVEYLRRNHAEDRVYLVGEPGLHEQLTDAGFAVDIAGKAAETGTQTTTADVAVVSIDREFDYGTLSAALRVIRAESVPIVGTDPDAVIPAAEGDVPGSGAIIAAVADVAEREPAAVLGKPHALTRELALERLGVPAEACLVVGDRLDTDIALGAASGMTTVLVRSGVTDDARLARSAMTPDYVVDSLAALPTVLDGEADRYAPER